MNDTVTFLDPWLREVKVEISGEAQDDHFVHRFHPPAGYQAPESQVTFKDNPLNLDELRYPIFLYVDTAEANPPWNILEHACRLNIMELASRVPLLDLPLAARFEPCPLHLEYDRMWIEMYHDGYPTSIEGMFKISRWWKEVSGKLHSLPEEMEHLAWKRGPSFKESSNMFPALQVTLWSDINGCNYAELDIDLESAKIPHGIEVFRNFITGEKTHPYTVAQLLAVYRGILTLRLRVRKEVVDAD